MIVQPDSLSLTHSNLTVPCRPLSLRSQEDWNCLQNVSEVLFFILLLIYCKHRCKSTKQDNCTLQEAATVMCTHRKARPQAVPRKSGLFPGLFPNTILAHTI